MESSHRIHAIASAPTNIQAALQSPECRAISQLLAKANVSIVQPLTIHELDAMLAGGGLSTAQRIQIKASLSRAGLLR
jgi:hypothetical protein